MSDGQYVIYGGEKGRDRLRLLAEVMNPATLDLLANIGIPAGAACLDVGCGGGDVAFELAAMVGSAGRVVGVDLDPVKLELARREAAARGLSNLRFEQCDVVHWAPGRPFDVVYARFLLTHLAEPAVVIAAMCRHLRPGGTLIVEDIDFRGHFSEPACPAHDRYVDLYTRSVLSRGGDPYIGPRLPALLRGAGLADVRMTLVHPAALEGGIKYLTCITLEGIAEAIVRDGLVDPDRLRQTGEELWAFARDPNTVLGGPRVFQVWGRR